MLIETSSKVLFIGDSITDCGRSQPIGEGNLGTGYVNVLSGLLGAVYPDRKLRLVNMGLSGNTVRDLDRRWARDVVQQSPDWLSVMIGINDVWRQFDSPMQPEASVDLATYAETLERMVAASMPNLKGVILMSPFFIEPFTSDPMRALMDDYSEVVRQFAKKVGSVFVDVQQAFNDALAHYHPAALAWDRVHPNIVGHTIIARAWLDAVGFEWSAG